ncbi:hypothetical protein PRABACTJOHN_01032 [Parabacteroides johnsonii DSM 18315]|uniref:Uncharacterized protein n=1 Tax=Parabacteroides johnsonii DSM 18315 TaxID=537006 RepID=B7B7N3_9BACT|nr:hypothetical protein PRABACTJOHN_01032 [Parabacteroides johnsonii DSM 18315]
MDGAYSNIFTKIEHPDQQKKPYSFWEQSLSHKYISIQPSSVNS